MWCSIGRIISALVHKGEPRVVAFLVSFSRLQPRNGETDPRRINSKYRRSTVLLLSHHDPSPTAIMAEELREVAYSVWPEPPPFYKHFTPENVERVKQLKADAAAAHSDNASSPQLLASQLLNLPTELRYLLPPEPPAAEDEFYIFGKKEKAGGIDDFEAMTEWFSRDLSESFYPIHGWEYERLYPTSPPSPAPGEDPVDPAKWTLDRQNYLFRLMRSVLLAFLELLGIVALNPTSPAKEEKLKNILTLMTNMHALINEYRPHQARETLIHIMERQLERKKAEVAGIKRMSQKVEETLSDFAKNAPDTSAPLTAEQVAALPPEERRKESQRHMWQAMDEVLGH